MLVLGLLQLTAVWHQWQTTLRCTVSAEFCSALSHRCLLVWPHLTIAAAAALTSIASVSHFQDHGADSSATSWSSNYIPCGSSDNRQLLSDVGWRIVHIPVKLKQNQDVSCLANT